MVSDTGIGDTGYWKFMSIYFTIEGYTRITGSTYKGGKVTDSGFEDKVYTGQIYGGF